MEYYYIISAGIWASSIINKNKMRVMLAVLVGHEDMVVAWSGRC